MLALPVLLAATLLALPGANVPRLVAELGHPEYDRREAATRGLLAVGEPALPALRAALAHEDAEVARRAAELRAAITKAAETERLLRPTLVTVDIVNRPISELLAALRTQSSTPLQYAPGAEPGDKPVTLRTGGPVPLWAALDALGRAEGLDVNLALVNDGRERLTVVLTKATLPAGGPRFTGHAVRVSTPAPAAGVALPADSLSVLLQTHSEPKVQLLRVEGVLVHKALDEYGDALTNLPALAAPAVPPPPIRTRGFRGGRIVQDADGIALVPDGAAVTNFVATPSQVLARFAAGKSRATKAALVEGVIHATVRAPAEEILRVGGLDAKPLVGATGYGVSLTAARSLTGLDDGFGLTLTVAVPFGELSFGSDEGNANTGSRGAASPFGGLALTDGAGAAYMLSCTDTSTRMGIDGRVTHHYSVLATRLDKRPIPPTTLVLKANRLKRIDIPFTLRDVPLHRPAPPPPVVPAPMP